MRKETADLICTVTDSLDLDPHSFIQAFYHDGLLSLTDPRAASPSATLSSRFNFKAGGNIRCYHSSGSPTTSSRVAVMPVCSSHFMPLSSATMPLDVAATSALESHRQLDGRTAWPSSRPSQAVLRVTVLLLSSVLLVSMPQSMAQRSGRGGVIAMWVVQTPVLLWSVMDSCGLFVY